MIRKTRKHVLFHTFIIFFCFFHDASFHNFKFQMLYIDLLSFRSKDTAFWILYFYLFWCLTCGSHIFMQGYKCLVEGGVIITQKYLIHWITDVRKVHWLRYRDVWVEKWSIKVEVVSICQKTESEFYYGIYYCEQQSNTSSIEGGNIYFIWTRLWSY